MDHLGPMKARPSENGGTPPPSIENGRALVLVTIELVRAGRVEIHEVRVPSQSRIRDALAAAGLHAEGCAVLEGEVPLPLDAPLPREPRLSVLPTFSGG
jgi:sulfur carrier protein ThiS